MMKEKTMMVGSWGKLHKGGGQMEQHKKDVVTIRRYCD